MNSLLAVLLVKSDILEPAVEAKGWKYATLAWCLIICAQFEERIRAE